MAPQNRDHVPLVRLYREAVHELRRQLDDLKKCAPPGTTRATHVSGLLTEIAQSSMAKITAIVPSGVHMPDPPYDPQLEFRLISRWFMSTLAEMVRAEMEAPGSIPDILISHAALTFWLYVDAERKRLDEEGYYYAHARRPA